MKKRPANLINVKFGDVPMGAEFWEKPDERGLAWDFPHVKVEPQEIQGDTMTAQTGSVLFGYKDEDVVQVEGEPYTARMP